MNYYPNNNFYQNYSGYQQQLPISSLPSIQGKVVDNQDMVRVSEVPFGGFGVFPKGDLSEIYVKSWSSNGTTQISTYKPIPVEETQEAKEASAHDKLLKKIDSLNEKLDKLMCAGADQESKTAVAAKDVRVNAY